ncbi:MAG: type II 3-dehydroquinate dehydratase [Rikenellaceae bacterium]
MQNILIINGANLNMLGQREVSVYGNESFESYFLRLKIGFSELCELDYFQSNIEGEIVDRLQSAVGEYSGVVLNAGGYTHTSVVIADAVALVMGLGLKVVEVHISNLLQRESFRHVSLISPVAAGTIWGFGMMGYDLGVESILRK